MLKSGVQKGKIRKFEVRTFMTSFLTDVDQVFNQIVGQVFGQVFDQVWKIQFCRFYQGKNTVLEYYWNRIIQLYSTTYYLLYTNKSY